MSQKTDTSLRDLSDLSASAAMDSDTATIPVAATSTSANLKLAPGLYKVALRGADATCHVFLEFGADNTVAIAADPSDTANNGDASAIANGIPSFRGDEIERIRVDAAKPWVAYKLSAGAAAAKLVFTKVV